MVRPLLRRKRRQAAPSTWSAVAKFAVGGLAALAAVGIGSYLLMRHIGTSEAIDNAKSVTRIVGREIVQPAVSDGILSERRSSIDRLDRVVRRRVLHDPIVRVKVWTRRGRIVYSDEPRLIGARYRLDQQDLEALRSGGVEADVSDLTRPREPVRALAGRVARGLSRHPRSEPPVAPVRVVSATQLDRGGRDVFVAGIRADVDRGAAAPCADPGPALHR